MAPSSTPSKLTFVWYEGPADDGRIKIFVSSRGHVKVDYMQHPMARSHASPWTQKADFGAEDVANLFQLAGDDALRHLESRSRDRTPGQDLSHRSLRVAHGKSPAFLDVHFVDTPPETARALAELERLYHRIKTNR